MRSSFMGLETSKRALLTQTVAMTTLGHNIANASTEGYTRQRVNMSTTQPIEQLGLQRSNTPGQLGTGVQYDNIERIRDTYLDLQYRRENQHLGNWKVQDATIQSIEDIVNEPSGTGLSAVMNKFWNSWEVLNRDPSLLSARIAVVGSSVSMVETLQHMNSALNNVSTDADSNMQKKLVEANDIIHNIAQLNDLIRRSEGFGDDSNDYRDKRDTLIDKLSSIVDVRVAETANGDLSITSAGVEVVNNGAFTDLTDATGATAGQLAGYAAGKSEVVTMLNQLNAMVNTLVTGKVKIRMENGYMANADMTALNDVKLKNGTTIAAGTTIPAGSEIVSPVEFEVNGFNGLHRMGYSYSDPSETDIPFFTTSDGSTEFTMANIQVNQVLQKDTSKIAASGFYETVAGVNRTIKGNGDIAHALTGLRDKQFTYPTDLTSLAQGTTDDYFRAMVSDLGTRSANAGRNLQNQQDLVDSVLVRRQSVSGVSLDEEMTEMIKFQHAYNAAARNMNTVDEMLDRVINQMGHVGR